MQGDDTTLADHRNPGEPLLQPVMRNGKRVTQLPAIEQIREHAAAELERLPATLKRLDEPHPYRVDVNDALRELAADVDRRTLRYR